MPEKARRHILITGASGRIGKELLPRFAELGDRITVLGRRQPGSSNAIGTFASDQLVFLRWDLEQDDLTPSRECVEILSSVTDLIHLASKVNEPAPLGTEALQMVVVNLVGVVRLLRFLENLEYICLLSTVAVYGPILSRPCKESHDTKPTRLYGVTKLALEELLTMHAAQRNIRLCALRPSSVYGFPDPMLTSWQAIPTFLRKCIASEEICMVETGKLLRDYVHVDDVIEAIATVVRRRVTGTFNIASGRGISLIDIAKAAGDLVGLAPVISWDYAIRTEADFSSDIEYDVSAAAHAFGYTPRISVREGMQRLLNQYKSAVGAVRT